MLRLRRVRAPGAGRVRVRGRVRRRTARRGGRRPGEPGVREAIGEAAEKCPSQAIVLTE
ncbi:hypothetical protein LT493_15770 [Streptomyces tricolor]|nr:hypothetical protein [Streptomyces tricolor]